MTEKLPDVVHQITNNPFRRSIIRRLQLDLDLRYVSLDSSNTLLRLIGPTLQELDIRVRPMMNWWLDCHNQHRSTDLKGREGVHFNCVEEDYIQAIIETWEEVLRGVEEFPQLARLSIISGHSIDIDLKFMLRRTPRLMALRISGRAINLGDIAPELPDLADTLPHLKKLRTVPHIPQLNTQLLLASKQSIEEVRGVNDLLHVLESFPSLRLLTMKGGPKTPQEWSVALAQSRDRDGFSELIELMAPVQFDDNRIEEIPGRNDSPVRFVAVVSRDEERTLHPDLDGFEVRSEQAEDLIASLPRVLFEVEIENQRPSRLEA